MLLTLFHWVLYIVGGTAIVLFLLWVVTLPLFKLFEEKIRDVGYAVGPDKMPLLQPVPIKTEDQPTFLHRLLVYFHVPRTWKLLENWHWEYTEPDQTKVELVVPKGFECDVASIPRPFRALFNPSGLLLLPSILHDYAFKHNQLWKFENGAYLPYKPDGLCCDKSEKRYWDDLLYRSGVQINGSKFINCFIWVLGRIGLSSGTWKAHQEARKRGEIATKAPE